MTQSDKKDYTAIDAALFSTYFPFVHAADRAWFVSALGPYSKRLNQVIADCRGQRTASDYKDFLRHNVAYVYAFLPVWESQGAQVVLQQAEPLLLSPREFRWLAQSSAAETLRKLCRGKFHPNLREQDRRELAQALASLRTGEEMAAWAAWGTAPAPVIASVDHPLMQHVLGAGDLKKGISCNSDPLGESATSTMRLIHEDQALTAYFYADSTLLFCWHMPINLSSVNMLAAGLLPLLRDRTSPIALISVVTPPAQASFESEARQLNVKLLKEYENVLTTAVAVIEGGGPRAALLRAATRLVKLASPPKLTMEVGSDVATSCRWLAEHFPNLNAAELNEATEQLRWGRHAG